MPNSKSGLVRAVVFSQWLMVLPAAIFLAAAAARLLQPRQYQPALASWILFQWKMTHVSHSGAALLLLVMPGLAAILGGVAVVGVWRKDPTFGSDVTETLTILGRHWEIAFLLAATLLAGAILLATVAHLVSDG
jgi:hypothetical protein